MGSYIQLQRIHAHLFNMFRRVKKTRIVSFSQTWNIIIHLEFLFYIIDSGHRSMAAGRVMLEECAHGSHSSRLDHLFVHGSGRQTVIFTYKIQS